MMRVKILGTAAAIAMVLVGVGRCLADKSDYNLPQAVNGVMPADAAMAKMETGVKPEMLAAFEKAHPADLWLFGEDRQLAVRNNIIPAHWFENGAKQFANFSGVARPGEFYVFQVCVIAGKDLENALPVVSVDGLAGAETKLISRAATVKAGDVKPFWVGIQVPADAKAGDYVGSATVGDAALAIHLTVAGDPIADGGTDEAWRLARLKWLDSTIGESETVVTRPFTAIVVDEKARTLDILGRRITLGEDGIPAQYTSYFSGSNTKILTTGRDAFAAAPNLECAVGNRLLGWKALTFKFTKQTLVGVEWEAVSEANGVTLAVDGRLEFDGNLQLTMKLAGGDGDVVQFVVPWAKGVAKYAMGLGLKGGLCPKGLDWKWDVSKDQDAIWMGDVNVGVMLRFKGSRYVRPAVNAYYAFRPLELPDSWGGGGVNLVEDEIGSKTLTAYSGPVDGTKRFKIDWYFTPFKPLNLAAHFADRFYHAHQGTPLEDIGAIHDAGARIFEIHHNRLCNPYINYPYNDDSIGHLTDFVKRAHTDQMRVDVYYTTRELTQNLPEFFALKSLDGEIILPRKAGVAWPVTNPKGPHPWLAEHVGTDIVPAWKEALKYPQYKGKLDLAVITTPESRWNNFYLEGLNYMVKNVGIDGLYIDDTALDGKSMQRARRILDADGNPNRLVDMHGWNYHNPLAAWANTSIMFMELYPYLDGLWHGEGFSADAPPDFMLVEMSGIPYGLMSEMLGKPNPWHGMVFGMTTRWPWSGDPRAIWKAEDDFGIGDAEFVGWWDSACPVKTSNPAVKISVYEKSGKTLIAIGNWGDDAKIKLDIDWKSLGLDPAKVKLTAPAIEKFQDAATFAAGDEIPVAKGKGWLIVAE